MKQVFLSILLMFMPMVASASIIDGINYDINTTDKTLTVIYGSYTGDLVIPSEVDLGEIYTVTAIAESAFGGCGGLTSVTIPNTVTTIGNNAFSDCTNLMSVTSNITEPYSINSNVFSTETYRKGTLYIPAGTEKLYTRFDGWREFLKIEETGTVGNLRGDLNGDGVVNAADIVELVNIIMGE